VKRDGFVGTWTQETGGCTRDTAWQVAINTFGVGLMFLPRAVERLGEAW
jgi:hypothetical protein